MNPSSMKYTIEINKYPISQSLNTNQFVLSASFISSETNDDICCSSKEFVKNHSVYGRFIKRAIIDSKVQSIENILLDSTTMKPISNLHIQLKFLLVSQFHNIQIVSTIAGIVIGSVAFLTVIIVCFIYYFYKNKKNKMLQQTLKRKLEKIGQNKI
ncbi:hypothetical protein ACTFIT_003022 [Dictyostelium discoideum]